MKCIHCNNDKKEKDFYRDKSKSSGFKPRCKPCDKLSVNRDGRREYERTYRENNKEARALIVKKSALKNKDHHARVRKLYLKTEAGIASYKKYTQKRYAIRKNAFIEDVDINELYIYSKGKCFYCSSCVDFKDIHVDHYIPLSKGGMHEKLNLRISCAHCNLSKGAKHPKELTYQMVQA